MMPDREKVMVGLTGLQLWLKGQLMLIPGHEDLQNALTVCTDALALLKEQEAVVHCKDCKHNGFHSCGWDTYKGYAPPDDWFCADGKRRTD